MDFTTIPRVRDGPRLWSLARTPASDPGWGGGPPWQLRGGWATAGPARTRLRRAFRSWCGQDLVLLRREDCGGLQTTPRRRMTSAMVGCHWQPHT